MSWPTCRRNGSYSDGRIRPDQRTRSNLTANPTKYLPDWPAQNVGKMLTAFCGCFWLTDQFFDLTGSRKFSLPATPLRPPNRLLSYNLNSSWAGRPKKTEESPGFLLLDFFYLTSDQ